MARSGRTSSLSIDLLGLIRRRKPEQRIRRLAPLAADELIGADQFDGIVGQGRFVPDTTVYIDHAAGRLPPAARDLMLRGLLFHCSVCLGELTTGIGARNPTLPSWPAERDHFAGLFDAIPDSRLLTPDEAVWVDAGLIAGILTRTQGFQPHQRKECLNDALIFLTAAKIGLPVLTANRGDFSLIQQLAPEGRFIHY
jgi:predicted nucleic acid-binding protein